MKVRLSVDIDMDIKKNAAIMAIQCDMSLGEFTEKALVSAMENKKEKDKNNSSVKIV